MRRIAVVLLVLASISGGALYYRQWLSAQVAAKVPSKPVIVSPENRRLETSVSATGIVRLRTGAEVKVGSQISGVVTKLNVGVGSHTSEGDIIAIIASKGLEERIAAAQAQIEIDRTAISKIDRELKRSRALLDYGLVPRQQTEDLEEDLSNAQSKLVKSQKDLAVTESDLPYLEIRAPITGTVASVSTLQGETVAASFAAPTFVSIIADDALELIAMVDETDIGGVRPGQPVAFTLQTYSSREFHGAVERIAPKATIVAGVVNYEVGIGIANGMALLKPDMTANVNIQTSDRKVLMIPDRAVHREGDRVYAELPDGSLRTLTLGSREGNWQEVRSGLTAEDRILAAAPKENK
jgi:macrolide-specific efflux system membrane fusion protein